MLLIPNRHFATQSGFTLIEIMIAVAIVGILVSIAIGSYQIQIRKTYMASVYQELNHFRLPYQVMIDEGAGVTEFSPNGLNIPAQTEYCWFSVTPPNLNGMTPNAVNCKIKNINYLQNQYLSLDRAADGSWQCKASVGIPKAYLPQACQ